MEVAIPHLSDKDIIALLLCTSFIEKRIDIPAIIYRLRNCRAIDSETNERLLRNYCQSSRKAKETRRNFYSFIISISGNVPFFTFCEALKQAGYDELARTCLNARLSKHEDFVVRSVWKVEHPNDEILHLYYVKKKCNIDNNKYKNQARVKFREKIVSLKGELDNNTNEEAVDIQVIVDKICVLFFLLSQQYASSHEVTGVLMEMRTVIPQNVNRTLFDTIFHSYMAFNCASSGEYERARSHLKEACVVSSFCAKGFVRIVAAQWGQYVNDILYRESQCKDKSLIVQAKACSDIIHQCLQDVYEWDKRHIWKTISELDLARATVGITPRMEMCDIENIDEESISQAENMIKHLKEPGGIRRKMHYHIILTRVHEKKSNHGLAMKHITFALELAPDGCYDTLGMNKISNYFRKLHSNRLPSPSIWHNGSGHN